jgi:hypothetical protein
MVLTHLGCLGAWSGQMPPCEGCGDTGILFPLIVSKTFNKAAGTFLRGPEERALQELEISDAY